MSMSDEPSATAPDPVMVRIAEGIDLRAQGRPGEAAELYRRLWTEIGGRTAEPLHRCALAHSMADVQVDPRNELRWDLEALAAADALTDEHGARGGSENPAAGFYPSLHLNLADCYRRLGDEPSARRHLERGLAAVGALGDDGYGRMIKAGLERLADRFGRPADSG